MRQVLTCDPLDTCHESGRIQSKPMQRDDCDGVAQELQVLETAVVLACGRASLVDPEVIVANFVCHLGLQFLGPEQPKRSF